MKIMIISKNILIEKEAAIKMTASFSLT